MALDATLQVRMDAQVKEQVEALYRQQGTTFAEVVRMLAAQSLIQQGMPFQVTKNHGRAFGIASKVAKPDLIDREEGAFACAMVAKHEADRR